MRPTGAPLTLLDHLSPSPSDSAQACMRRAVSCSRLAKVAHGALRDRLYGLKNSNIRVARDHHPQSLEFDVDSDRFFGLLSVRLRAAPSVRVHTHENWLDPADHRPDHECDIHNHPKGASR